ncbi:MAG: hypothetical protein LW701_01950 [Fluviicola sp.]|nr:hypothetical protein [Fluviicola sp.]
MDKVLLKEIRRMQELAGIRLNNENFVPVKSVNLFCENKITEKEFYEILDSELISENIFTDLKTNFVDKIANYLNTFLLQAYSVGFSILSKVKQFISWTIGAAVKLLKNFSNKYPLLFKLIIITIIVFVLLIVFCTVAKAAATGTPIPKHELNIAIGILEDTKKIWFDTGDDMQRMKAIKILVDLRDGHTTTMNGFGNDVQDVVQTALQKAQNIHANTRTVIDSEAGPEYKESVFNVWQDLLEKGRSVVSATYSKAQSSGSFEETIKIVDKAGGEETMTKSGFSVTMGGN